MGAFGLEPSATRSAHTVSPARSMSGLATKAGFAGLASFILIVVAAFVVAPPLWSAPGTTASATQIAAYAHNNGTASIASLFVYSVAFGFFLCFAAGLWAWLRQTEPEPQPFTAAFAFGAVALVVLILAAFATGGVLSYRLQEPAVAQVLRDLTFALLALSGIPTAVCLAAYARVTLKGGGLPAWTAWFALLGAIAHLFIAASFIGHGSLLSLEGSVIVLIPGTFFAWILITSVALLSARPTARTCTPPRNSWD